MQRIGELPGQPLVVVDYAHTPDALDKVLAALQPVAQARGGRLVAVFGAGGGRDAGKRPQMGLAASRRADRIVLTSDNPRGEDPLAIIEAIRGGIAGACAVEPDRAKAITGAIAAAEAADVVLIAGKGHESFQEIAGRRLPFSDAAVAGAALARRGAQ
jgi:UDP-N-acetylmuramoyl-L-alanyl-D-glutamate--2,6-diaminopimelate ligase